MTETIRDLEWEQRLDQRRILELNATSPIAIKRDTHTFEVNAPAEKLSVAFHAAMVDPTRRFGVIQVFRKKARLGQPFEVGERFQGCARIRHAIGDALEASPLVSSMVRPLESSVKQLLGPNDHALLMVEDGMMSDFGEIVELRVGGRLSCLKYVYLSGSMMAGSSTFIVESTGDMVSRITQIFEFQELRSAYVLWFGTSLLKVHNGVVFSQVQQAAEIAGGQIVSTTMPAQYRTSIRPSSAPPPSLAHLGALRVPGPAPLPFHLDVHDQPAESQSDDFDGIAR
jgi:hypothetical protein